MRRLLPTFLRSVPSRDAECDDRNSIWESVRERIRELWRYSGIGSFSGFAQACCVGQERLEEILETEEIDDETAEHIARSLNVAYEWVKRGTGPFQCRRMEAEGRGGFESAVVSDCLPERLARCKPTKQHEFIHVGKASANIRERGEIFLEESTTDERYAFSADWLRSIGVVPGHVVLLEVEGDSMNPVLREGDTVLIDLDRTRFKEGRLFAVGIGDSLFVKRLQLITGTKGPQIRVISVNPEYHAWECGPEDIRILGEVVWLGRTMIQSF